MFKKHTVFVFITLPLLYRFTSKMVGYFASEAQSLAGFQDIIEQLVVGTGLLILGMSLAGGGRDEREEKEERGTADTRSHRWLMGFASILFIMLAFVIYVNPHSRFPWKYFPFAYTTVHSEKLSLFEARDVPPRIIVLGSSRAFTMPADYIKAATGYETFNMSVTSATPLDLFALEKFVIDRGRETPVLFIVEVLGRGLVNQSNGQDNMPMPLLQYLPIQDAAPIIASAFEDTISLASLSDALFTWSGYTIESKVVDHYLPDGTAVFKARKKPLNADQQFMTIYSANYSCKTVGNALNAGGQAYIERMVSLAEQYQFSIVFYRSPLKGEFFDKLDAASHKSFDLCITMLNAYFDALSETYPNIYYLDLTQYQPVNKLGDVGFIDLHHPDHNASQMIYDALHPKVMELISEK